MEDDLQQVDLRAVAALLAVAAPLTAGGSALAQPDDSRSAQPWRQGELHVHAARRPGLSRGHRGHGRLYRVDTRTDRITPVDDGPALTGGDGTELQGRTLYVVRNRQGVIAEVRLSCSARAGRVVFQIGERTFRHPPAADTACGRLLVINAQFDRCRSGQNPRCRSPSAASGP